MSATKEQASEETLQSLRGKWEQGLEEKCALDTSGRFGDYMKCDHPSRVLLVVLEDDNEKYHCHRYFYIGHAWECSVDAQRVNLETVWGWLPDPMAI